MRVLKNPDPKMRMIFDFFESQGAKFVDADTGEEIRLGEPDE